MATHSSILAWRIPWTEEPGGLQSMGSQGGVQTAKASRKQSSLSGKESAQGLQHQTVTACGDPEPRVHWELVT